MLKNQRKKEEERKKIHIMIINETMPIVPEYSSNETIMSDCSSNEMETENFNLKHNLNMVLSLKKKVKCYTKRLNYLNEISQKNLKDIERCCDELIHHFKDEKIRKGVVKTFNSKKRDVLGSLKSADDGIQSVKDLELINKQLKAADEIETLVRKNQRAKKKKRGHIFQ